jgi:hypothetical protein
MGCHLHLFLTFFFFLRKRYYWRKNVSTALNTTLNSETWLKVGASGNLSPDNLTKILLLPYRILNAQ